MLYLYIFDYFCWKKMLDIDLQSWIYFFSCIKIRNFGIKLFATSSLIPLNLINPFHAVDIFLYPLKIWENQRFFRVFRGYRKRTVPWNGSNLQWLKYFLNCFTKCNLGYKICGDPAKYLRMALVIIEKTFSLVSFCTLLVF